MPTGPLIATRLIVNTVLQTSPKRIVDLGMGTGKYGFLLREQSDLANGRIDRDQWTLQIDGVEGFAEYVDDHQRSVYDEVFVENVTKFLGTAEERSYDWALALDIIEHFDVQDALGFLDGALRTAGFVFVSTPKGFYPQTDQANELETHRSWWPTKALRKAARLCEAQIKVAQVRMVNLAVLSRADTPPQISTERGFEVGSFVKDTLLPEVLYYRAIHKAGPSILASKPDARIGMKRSTR